jgi:ABC-type ATPase with predicted acetyltransferase domain
MEKLIKSSIPLISSVDRDDFILASEKAFDCIFDGTSKFYPWILPSNIPENFNIGVIVGSSGSGKSTLLHNFGFEDYPEWDNSKSIISHFNTPDEAINRMGAVGLNTIPSWYKPYSVLSNGEKFRADLARKLKSGSVIDEFTSVIDRNVAKAASMSLARYIKNNNINNIVLATCHRDIIEWLQPDWIIDTDTGEFHQGFFLSVQKSKLIYTEQAIVSGQCLKSIII